MPIKIVKIFDSKIVKWLKFVSDNLKDDKLKNRKIVNFIKIHTLIMTLFISLIGLLLIFYSSYEITKKNTITIQSSEAKYISVFYNDSSVDFNISEDYNVMDIYFVPKFFSEITIEYKEPVIRCDHIKINDITTSITWFNKSFNNNINEINIVLGGSEDSRMGMAYIHQKNLLNSYADYENFSVDDIFIPLDSHDKVDDSIILTKENQNNEYEFWYEIYYDYPIKEHRLNYNLKPTWIVWEGGMPQKGDIMIKRNKREGYVSIQGEGTLNTPIRGADPIEELNIWFNQKILFLTGLLIIFGSLPFCRALKELLQ
jgi:hypothetical protein